VLQRTNIERRPFIERMPFMGPKSSQQLVEYRQEVE